MPFFICPNCKERSVDLDGYDGFSMQAAQCRSCAFGFLFELLEDYYPAPETGFVVCDRDTRVLAAGREVFELTGYRDADLIGRDVAEALALSDVSPIEVVRASGFVDPTLLIVVKWTLTTIVVPALIGVAKEEAKDRLTRLWKEVLLPAIRGKKEDAIN